MKRRIAAAFFALILLLSLAVPLCSAGNEKLVRVGWYESSFNTADELGRRSGYAYEYQMKIAAYTGWDYVYVKGSWSDLMDMLMAGEIDLMSDVSYTDERAEKMLFPDLSMGTEEYWLFISPNNSAITPEDYSSLNGKRIAMNRGSVQYDIFLRWQAQHGVSAEIVELSCEEDESLRMLDRGEIDGYITPNTFRDTERLVPVCKIGSTEFYFAVSSDRPDLLSELNAALSRIQDESPYYNQQMFEKHVQTYGANAFLSASERAWLDYHGAIRVGYQDNYLAFCAVGEDGELTGALADYLSAAATCLNNGELIFETTGFNTASAALEALKRGEVDCVFPANLGSYDGEIMDLVMTPALLRSDMYAVVRAADQDIFAGKAHVVVAVNEGNPNYVSFLRDNFPSWQAVYFPTTDDCLEAVSRGVADCVLVSSFRYNNISRRCDRLRLIPCSTGARIEYSFAVRNGETELYSVLAKVVGVVPDSAVSEALSRYITADARTTLSDLVSDNLPIAAAVIAAVVLIILILLIMSLAAGRRARNLIKATELDSLTGLYNRDYFFQYAERMYRERPDAPRDAIVINVDHFHSINALSGRAFGDKILRTLGKEILRIAKERGGIAGRYGADRFDLYCRGGDDHRLIFERLQTELDGLSRNAAIRLRMGVMPFEAGADPTQMFDMASAACSKARGSYKEQLVIFDERIRKRELTDQRLLHDLRRALDSYEFEVWYQPKYDIRGEKPRLQSAEALVRWQHPELGLIPPGDFIPLFERNGKIGELDRFVWSQAARQIARWRAEFGITVPVSVNLSRVDVFDPTLLRTLDGLIEENRIPRDALKLEVTESAYTENSDEVIRVVESLRAHGYTVEMDDFGTGYSSLNMLSSMPVDVLKMDRTFIRDLETSERDVQLVELILGLARSLNIPVVAEGVETKAQLDMLKKLGCTFVQGFYFSRPLHPGEFESKILNERKEVK